MKLLLLSSVAIVAVVACGESSSHPPADAGADGDIAGDGATSCHAGDTRGCGTDVGACEFGVETCAAGVWGGCTGGVAPATELCDGVLDEDCNGAVDNGCTTDPFDPASCGGPPPTALEALAILGPAMRTQLALATVQVRTRTCTGMSCGAWSAASNWQTHFLTYSGGVTTRYKDVQADTRLVLYAATGMPRLSVQHVTFTQGNYPDSMGIVFDFPAMPITYPVFRAYNVAPMFPSDYTDLELTLKDGVLEVGTRCARFTATVFGSSPPYTTGYAALYRW